ncbi:MAG: MATE family efflux transporter [Eubacteriales bacterium]|nr:MATE family efflux transporter [Eubacteriales bacterium]
MEREESILGAAPVGKLVLQLAVPAMLAQFVNILYSVVDRMYVGHIAGAGDVSLAGVGVCAPVVTMITAFAALVGFGGGPLMSIRMGRRDMDGARQIVANSFYLLLALSVVVTVPALLLRRPILFAFGASEQLWPYANAYFTVYAAGTVFALLSVGLNQIVMSQGFSGTAMRSVMLGAAVNIALDPLLIFALDMGVRGAALATVLSQACSTAYTLRFLFGTRAAVGITKCPVSTGWLRRIVQVGLSPALIIALDNVLLISVNVMLRRHGGADSDMLIACAAILQSFMLIITMPLGGITTGTQAILGYNYGAGDTRRVLRAEKYILLLCFSFCAVMLVLAQTLAVPFARIFTSDPAYIEQTAWMIRAYTLGVLGLAVQYPFVDGLTGMGLVKWGLIFSMFRKAVFLLGVCVLPAVFSATALLYAEPVSDLSAALVSSVGMLVVLPRLMRKREREG